MKVGNWTFDQACFAADLKDKREREGLSYRQLSAMLGISHTMFYVWEEKGMKPGVDHYFIMCEWLGRPLTYFFYQNVRHDTR
jgi:transcriptional regulator with XRE-family HTH domain